jgi:hypothetical protein
MKSSSSSIINWNNIIKKEARSITNDVYLGSIQGLYEPFIVVEEKGALNQKKYFIPKDLLGGYDDIAVYFRAEGIDRIIMTKKEEGQEQEEILRKNNSSMIFVFNTTRLAVEKAKETATELKKEIFHPVAKVTAIAAGRIVNLLEYAMKFTNRFVLALKKHYKLKCRFTTFFRFYIYRFLNLIYKNFSFIISYVVKDLFDYSI